MNHLITAITFTVILGIVSGAPLLTCDKIKDVNQGKDNQDRYLVILKDPKSYQDAEYVMGIVDLYQWSLETNAFNVYNTSVKSQLELLENVGLQGTLSKQALFLVCMDSRVESLIPDYPMIPELTEGSGDVTEEDTVDCSKLILTEPYTGEDYSVVLKSRVSTTDLFNIISKMEQEKLSDEDLSITFHYATRPGRAIKLVVTMNTKALEMICKEQKVKVIKPNSDISVIDNRNVPETVIYFNE
ncbi:uncharacterized protein [Dysidea avara]|uniref:uncharacterized protein n=1 Tax=Dysidea avara TaxID=196820 RepID=UPI0033257979